MDTGHGRFLIMEGSYIKEKGCKIKIINLPPYKKRVSPKPSSVMDFGGRWVAHLGRLASPGGGGIAVKVGTEGAEEAHRVHGPAADLCV